MNPLITAHFIVTAMCLMVYMFYGAFGKAEITPFTFLIVLGIALIPVLNIIYTIWCTSYLVYSLLQDLMQSLDLVKKKALEL